MTATNEADNPHDFETEGRQDQRTCDSCNEEKPDTDEYSVTPWEGGKTFMMLCEECADAHRTDGSTVE